MNDAVKKPELKRTRLKARISEITEAGMLNEQRLNHFIKPFRGRGALKIIERIKKLEAHEKERLVQVCADISEMKRAELDLLSDWFSMTRG